MKPHHEHEFEAAPGLPEALPAGELILWQGSPDWKMLAVDAFHVRRLAIYFSLMIALHAVMIWDTSLGLLANLSELSIVAILASVALSLLALTAWLSASTTMYTITNRRVVMRIGIVLTLTFNLPYKRIAGASLKGYAKGMGDIALALHPEDRIGWAHLWPHQRAWHVTQPQPTLRCVADSQQVGELLLNLWRAERAGQSLHLGDAPANHATAPSQGMLA